MFLRQLFGINEVGPQLRQAFCHFPILREQICDAGVLSVVLPMIDLQQMNFSATTTLKKLMGNSMSARQALHYMQLFLMADFRQYDFGPDQNLRKYKRRVPPSYDLKNATAPAALFSGFADNLVLSFNVDRLARTLPNTVFQYRVPWILFNHFDFIIARDVVQLLYEKVFQIMDEYRE